MTTEEQLKRFTTKQEAYDLYRDITGNPDAKHYQFMDWAGFTKQAWYTWKDPLPEPLRYQLYGRLHELYLERESNA